MRKSTLPTFLLVLLFLNGCTQADSRNGKTVLLSDVISSNASAMAEQSNAISKCMKSKGFQYVPSLPSARASTSTDDPAGQRVNGYGIATSMAESRAAQKLEKNGPNFKYRSSLGPAQQSAFDEALEGSDGKLGCLGAQGRTGQVRQTLMKRYEEFYPRVQADSRIRALDERWSSCMQKKGYKVSTFVDVFFAILSPLEQEVPRDLSVSDSEFESSLQSLREEELRVARADAACTTDSDRAERKAVKAEYDLEFSREQQTLILQIPSKT